MPGATTQTIPFNRPAPLGNELLYIHQAIAQAHLAGDGAFTRQCQTWLQNRLNVPLALLTHSCTAALEMAAMLCDLQPGDEVVMPSFTFVSTANAVVLRGAIPVFVDIRPDTPNIDESLIQAAITPRTRAIFVVHYAGIACDMDAIMAIAARHGLIVVEDAAQALLAEYRGRPLGSIGHLAALSFHETKNVISGEGGALLVNDPALAARAEILRDKGTNRTDFIRGGIDRYTWVDIGSSYLPSDIIAAFLLAQLEQAAPANAERHRLWNRYHAALAAPEAEGHIARPTIPPGSRHNAHLYYILAKDRPARDALIATLAGAGIQAPFHYVPLHSSPAGLRYGRTAGPLPMTDDIAARLLRLPLWNGLDDRQHHVIQTLTNALTSTRTTPAPSA